jgi:translocator protein
MIAAVKIIPSFWKFILAILICETVGIASGLLSQNEINTWFTTLNKPTRNPTGCLFSPVWTTLYFLTGISLWLIGKTNAAENRKRNAVTIFAIQLFLNFWWSLLFFKFHSPGLAFIDIVLLLISILSTIYYFFRHIKISGLAIGALFRPGWFCKSIKLYYPGNEHMMLHCINDLQKL